MIFVCPIAFCGLGVRHDPTFSPEAVESRPPWQVYRHGGENMKLASGLADTRLNVIAIVTKIAIPSKEYYDIP
jgi:hypothetical protein